ncbi:MAG: exodeoxyribonuclease I [Buchnera aphidicola (Periphyllus aceris)]|nr:exodeoxyribonuclease I [Buchnera aphidicola (Periphyllus aceris)]
MKTFLPINFLFYDYETFGINPIFDKPSQFACIRTDSNFKIISNPVVLYCYPPIDYLPDPNAVLITSITPQYTRKFGLNESNFSKKINFILNKYSNTCILGFNNICFDDEITRNIFYRNFFDSYEWSWKNNNTRWDVLNLMRAFYALRPDGINWPINKKRIVSFKLSHLTKINNLSHYKAHDALSDVYATINLLKLIKLKNLKFFNFLFFIRKKKNLLLLVQRNFFRPLIFISSIFGSKNNNIGYVIPLIVHEKNKNILIVFDLNKDYCFETFIKKYEKNFNLDLKILFKLGMKLIYLNKCPILIPFSALRKEDILRLNLDKNKIFENFIFLKNFFCFKRKNILSKIIFKDKEYRHIDESLYKSFFSYSDKKKICSFRNLINNNIIKNDLEIFDKRFNDLLFFFQARNFPYTLTKKNKYIWKKYLISFFNKKKIFLYKKSILDLKKQYFNDSKKFSLLKDLLEYLKYLIKNIKKI